MFWKSSAEWQCRPAGSFANTSQNLIDVLHRGLYFVYLTCDRILSASRCVRMALSRKYTIWKFCAGLAKNKSGESLCKYAPLNAACCESYSRPSSNARSKLALNRVCSDISYRKCIHCVLRTRCVSKLFPMICSTTGILNVYVWWRTHLPSAACVFGIIDGRHFVRCITWKRILWFTKMSWLHLGLRFSNGGSLLDRMRKSEWHHSPAHDGDEDSDHIHRHSYSNATIYSWP